MFINLPDLTRWEEVASYTEIFLFTLLYNLMVYGIWTIVLFIILLILKLYQINKQKQQKLSRESLITYQSARGSQNTMRTSQEE